MFRAKVPLHQSEKPSFVGCRAFTRNVSNLNTFGSSQHFDLWHFELNLIIYTWHDVLHVQIVYTSSELCFKSFLNPLFLFYFILGNIVFGV